MKEKLAGYRHIPLQERIPLLLSHFCWGKAKGGRWERTNWFLLLCNPTQVQILLSFWIKTPSWPPHSGPWEITSNSCTNLYHLLQLSDGKAAALRTPLLPRSQGSLRVLPLSCDDHSCLLPHSITACLTPKDLLLFHLHLAQRHMSQRRNRKRHRSSGSQLAASRKGLESLLSPFLAHRGTGTAHQRFSARCFTSSAKAGLFF